MKKEEAITILSEIRSKYNCFSHVEGGRYHALSMGIEALTERKHGKWKIGSHGVVSDATVKWYDQFIMGGFIYCSNCKERSNKRSNFCPNCGADMRGDNDGNS